MLRCGRRALLEEVKPYVNRSSLKLTALKHEYARVLNLVEHSAALPADDLFQYCVTATMLAMFLQQRTAFFSPKADVEEDLCRTFQGRDRFNAPRVQTYREHFRGCGGGPFHILFYSLTCYFHAFPCFQNDFVDTLLFFTLLAKAFIHALWTFGAFFALSIFITTVS